MSNYVFHFIDRIQKTTHTNVGRKFEQLKIVLVCPSTTDVLGIIVEECSYE